MPHSVLKTSLLLAASAFALAAGAPRGETQNGAAFAVTNERSGRIMRMEP
jgi:hypothetical protein